MTRTRLLSPWEAQQTLERCGVWVRDDYHTLSSVKVDSLLNEAKKHGYRKSGNAPGSTARMFHAYLIRRATYWNKKGELCWRISFKNHI